MISESDRIKGAITWVLQDILRGVCTPGANWSSLQYLLTRLEGATCRDQV